MYLFLLLIFHAFGAHSRAQTLVALSPQVAESLFQVGLGDKTAGVVSGSLYPPEAGKLPSVGALFAPSVERTLHLKPDWVVADSQVQLPGFKQALQALGLGVFTWNTHSPEAWLESARALLAKMGLPVPAHLDRWKRCLDAARSLRHPPGSERGFLAFVWLSPPMLFGTESFLSHLMEIFGFSNQAPTHWKGAYLGVTDEWLVSLRPSSLFYLEQMGTEMAATSTAPTPEPFTHWWGGGNTATPLPAGLFARASLTAMREVKKLAAQKGYPLPPQCHGEF